MTTFQKQDQQEQQEQQEQHQRSSDTEKEELIYATTTTTTNKNKNKSRRNNNNNEIIFEEKTYVGDDNDDDVRVVVEEGGLQAKEVTEDVVGLVEVETEVPLHIAVRQCWPKLFPTKSSSKKYIRKGLFTVAVGRLHHHHHHQHHDIKENANGTKVVEEEKVAAETNEKTYYQKGKCDTKIKIGDIIRRKIQKGEQQQKQPKGGGQDEIQVRQHVQPHFRNRGTSTSEIIQRAIGGKLCIAYLDQYIAVVIKPYGMPVNKVQIQKRNHQSQQQQQQQQKVISLHELLLHCMPQQHQQTQQTPHSDDDVGLLLRRPACIHRLDQVTYGLIIVAITSSSARYLSQQFECSYKTEKKLLQKRYRAIVYGHIRNVDNSNNDQVGGRSYFITTPLSGKECITEYRIVRHLVVPSAATISNAESSSSEESSPTITTTIPIPIPVPISIVQLTLVDLFPHTGRTHQLRKHMEYIGHPIVGDRKYNDMNKNGINTNNNSKSKRRIDKISEDDNGGIISFLKEEKEELMLAAIELQFLHPKFASEESEDESSTAATAFATATAAAAAAAAAANSTATATADHNISTTTPTTSNGEVSIASGSGGGSATATPSASASDYHVFAKDSETYIDRSKGTLKVKIDMPTEMKQLLLRSL